MRVIRGHEEDYLTEICSQFAGQVLLINERLEVRGDICSLAGQVHCVRLQ